MALKAHEVAAAAAFAPVMDAMEEAAARRDPAAPYDIDKTVRTIHAVDRALAASASLDDYLRAMAREDFRDVAPEVLLARRELMDVLWRMYVVQVEKAEQDAMWGVASELLLGSLSVVSLEAEVSPVMPTGSVRVDGARARALYERLEDEQDARMALGKEGRKLERQLIQALVAYSNVYYEYLEEWERVCVARDRAYLAVSAGDWALATAAANEAIRLAPLEREAHLLRALARIESGAVLDSEIADAVADDLSGQIAAHPEHSAPALLLLGTLKARRGDVEGARVDLAQAAAYFPRQASHLTDMLDPYAMRAWLRKTREGSWVRDQYQASMLGAGYFSPDLQLARLHFDSGEHDAGRAKVLDHFSRRRAQRQWDLLLADVALCTTLLGEDYRRIFPEDAWLDLELEEALFGSKLSLSVVNRSDRTLHNATLVLALQLTDMHVSDYAPLVAGETVPEIPAHATTQFGTTEVAFSLDGDTKTVEDIVSTRAILVSNEAVVWVDTAGFKLDAAGKEAPGSGSAAAGRFENAMASAREARLKMEGGFLTDAVEIRIPRRFAILRPVFELHVDGARHRPAVDHIDGDVIALSFTGIAKPQGAGRPTLILHAETT
ncbi:MAG: hypothetical protein VX000_02745, partial [Myxococcota bacterium]|nr:hypothetical protein [Myxococcota bacterium]